MPEIREIIARLRAKATKHEIHRETGTHSKVIREIERVGLLLGLLGPNQPLPAEADLA